MTVTPITVTGPMTSAALAQVLRSVTDRQATELASTLAAVAVARAIPRGVGRLDAASTVTSVAALDVTSDATLDATFGAPGALACTEVRATINAANRAPNHAEPVAALDLPPVLARELRRLLAEALVADYLADQQALKPSDGDSSLGDATPSASPEPGDAPRRYQRSSKRRG
jgi:hypothetical protein